MKDYHINIFYSAADGGYIADIPDLKACSAFGKTPSEALKQVEIAKKLGWKRPAPRAKPFPSPNIVRLSIKRLHTLRRLDCGG